MMGWSPPVHSSTSQPYSACLYFLTTPKFPSFLPPAAYPLPGRRDGTHVGIKSDQEEDLFKALSVSQSSLHCSQTDLRVLT